jgi:hypothetical protein
MADVQTASLYEQDFYLWSLDQAQAVRTLRDAVAGQSDLNAALSGIDWENVIEELEGLATGVRSELRNRLSTITEHLVKLELSTATDPKRGWEETIQRSRREIRFLLDDNPSLRREVEPIVLSPIFGTVAKDAVADLVRRGEIPRGTAAPAYTREQILDDWWPDQRATTP